MEIVVWLSYAYVGIFFILIVAVGLPAKKSNTVYTGILSICVPFRNESANLVRHCSSIKSLDDINYEILYADDHSEDDSSTVCRTKGFPVYSVSCGEGKIAALTEACKHAKGEILVFTDADCTVPDLWLRTLRTRLHDAGLCVGMVSVREMPLMTLDFYCLIGVAAGLYRLGIPSSCPGANIAVSSHTYKEFLRTISFSHATDDAALLHFVHSYTKKKIHFLFSRDNMVTTEPYKTCGEFFQQRFRWVKGGIRLNPWLTMYLLFVYVAHCTFFVFPTMLWVPILCGALFSGVVILKMRDYKLLPLIPLYGIFFVVYTTVIGLLFPFLNGRVRWKGRSL